VIAPPVPSGTVLPGWFRQLPGVDTLELSATNDGLTVKRCMPFLDALTTGWILPLAADVRLEIADEGKTVHAGWEFDREMVSNHAAFQAAGNPYEPRPVQKFHNHWTIRTAPGWSCLFLPPLNRTDEVVRIFAGVVDTDTYTAPVNLPFVAIGDDGVHLLAKGTPLAQIVPFRRADTELRGEVRAETPEEADRRIQVHRNTRAGAGWYRRHARSPRHRRD
jgi:hypothetical protein